MDAFAKYDPDANVVRIDWVTGFKLTWEHATSDEVRTLGRDLIKAADDMAIARDQTTYGEYVKRKERE